MNYSCLSRLNFDFFSKFKITLFVLFLTFTGLQLQAQGPGSLFVDAGPDVTIDCATGNGCTTLMASFLETFDTANQTYQVNSITYNPPFPFNGLANSLNPDFDDRWSAVDNLPFDFCFFGDLETQFQVGSNGVIRFDVDPTDISNGWSFSENLPNNTNPTLGEANIFTPVHDIDPSVSASEEIAYEVLGTFPNRVLVVSYFEVPMFSGACNSLLATHMAVFYEFSNVIEIYIQDKPSCPTWNSGNAALGIQNDDGNIAFVPPGRNTSDSPWTTNNEAWSFSPVGDATYVFEWLDAGGTVLSNDPNFEVCPTDVTTYTARVTWTNTCNSEIVTLEDTVTVTPQATFTADLGGNQTFCDTPSYTITPVLDGVNPADATYLWSTGETTPTITVTTTDTYSVDITANGCTITESVDITFLVSPDCFINSVCGFTDFEENFGTGIGLECDLNGATTTYVCYTGGQMNDGEYVLSNTSTGLNSGWHIGMEDHTPDDVDGRMYFVNADFATGEFYRRTITLDPNEDYTFSAWITTVYDTDTGICTGTGIPSNVIFRIEDTNGNLIQETNTGDIQNGPEPLWQEFTIDFNTGNNTDIQLILVNNSIGGCGNDLAIDDITLFLLDPEPQIATPDNLTVCDTTGTGTATFNLDNQTPIILDGQDPALFNVSYHLSLFEAQANTNAIADTANYTNTTSPEEIFVRVEKVNEPSCFSTTSFLLIVDPIINLQINLPASLIICSTDPFPEYDATPQNPDVDLSLVTYEWTNQNGDLLSTNALFSPTEAGIYTVFVTYPPCTEETQSTSLVIVDTPTLELGEDQIICDGGEIEIIPIITGDTDNLTYLWSTGETTPTIIVNATGTYSLEITLGPCIVSDSVNISISEIPEIIIGDDFKTCPNEAKILTATTNAIDPTFIWFLNGDLIEGETNSTLEITLASSTVGQQIYTVQVSDGICENEASIGVELYGVDNCVISEGLSPNGDGFNDFLDLEFLADRSGPLAIEIFNRYGMSLFQQENYINEFRGLDRDGNELTTGTYFYVIKFSTPDPVYGEVKTGWVYINKEIR